LLCGFLVVLTTGESKCEETFHPPPHKCFYIDVYWCISDCPPFYPLKMGLFFLCFKLLLSYFQQTFLPLVCIVIAPFSASRLHPGLFVPNCAPLSLCCSSHSKYCFLFTLVYSKGWLLFLLLNKQEHAWETG
jgi:hypothetical protein